jgi:two-component system sensor histidine kinase PilS (NtrC family)
LENVTQVSQRPAIRWILLARVVLGTLFLISALGLQYGGAERYLAFRFFPVYFYTGVIYFTSIGFELLLSRAPNFRGPVTTTLTAIDLALVFGLTTYTGGSASPFLFLYLFIIIGAAILKLRRGALIMTALSMVLIGTTFLIEFYAKLPTEFLLRYFRPAPSEFLVTSFYNITAFYVVGILSSYLAERLRTAGEEIDRLDLDITILKGLQERIIDNVASGLLTLDELGRILLVNRQAEKILEQPAGKLRGQLATKILGDLVLTEDSGGNRLELTYRSPSGADKYLGYSVSNILIEPRRVGSIVVFQDLTRMKELEAAVKRQEKLAALGSMAAGIAHEIRNPLGSISGSLQMLKQGEQRMEEEYRPLIGIALHEIDRLNQLVEDFLLYARPKRRADAWVPLAPLVAETIETLENDPKIADQTRLRYDVPPEVGVRGDPHTLKQILLNLILNAVQAGAQLVEVKALKSAAQTVVDIIDDGPGIPPEIMAQLFEPFFSTRPDGVGLGLAIVYRLMEEHQGTIVAQSTPGRTVMRLTFPAQDAIHDPNTSR